MIKKTILAVSLFSFLTAFSTTGFSMQADGDETKEAAPAVAKSSYVPQFMGTVLTVATDIVVDRDLGTARVEREKLTALREHIEKTENSVLKSRLLHQLCQGEEVFGIESGERIRVPNRYAVLIEYARAGETEAWNILTNYKVSSPTIKTFFQQVDNALSELYKQDSSRYSVLVYRKVEDIIANLDQINPILDKYNKSWYQWW